MSRLQTIFLPVVGLVDPDKLKPRDLVGVNKDSYLILDTMILELRPWRLMKNQLKTTMTLEGLRNRTVSESRDSPTQRSVFVWNSGTEKTLMARACAAQTNATFLKLVGPKLVKVCFLFSPFLSATRKHVTC
ncbi:hypothetical protein RHGRI_000970 [Rhododendron griersonianum]|uniref:ATPase AAA-type core domain-containing protein n=1 Tax=Rhododendron griersonianum TaxID=479676 RepID=A0AAV6LM22_9ERIC|nr:hypothetical protein RHGRI_000970 [Rhododendron griersonianum]